MTDPQRLIAPCVATGSKSAFPALVARYVDLAHSAANLALLGTILDEAANPLGAAERTAIRLQFL